MSILIKKVSKRFGRFDLDQQHMAGQRQAPQHDAPDMSAVEVVDPDVSHVPACQSATRQATRRRAS